MDKDGQTCQKRFKTVKIVKNGGSGQKQSIIIENGPKIGWKHLKNGWKGLKTVTKKEEIKKKTK